MSAASKKLVYLIGSLRNKRIVEVAKDLEESTGYEVFASWYAAGPEADDYWKAYETERGKTYAEALAGHAAQHVYAFDKKFLDRADAVVLVLPAGKSGHLELGYAIGQGKPGLILLDPEVDRWDVMYNFASLVAPDLGSLAPALKRLVG